MGLGLGIFNTAPRRIRLGPFRLDPQVIRLPSVDSSSAQVGQTLTATPGVYEAVQDGAITTLAQWRINNIPVSSDLTYTPRAEDEGQLLEFVEIVTETDGGAVSLTALRTTVLPGAAWQTDLNVNHLIIMESPGPSAAPVGAVSDTTFTFLQEA